MGLVTGLKMKPVDSALWGFKNGCAMLRGAVQKPHNGRFQHIGQHHPVCVVVLQVLVKIGNGTADLAQAMKIRRKVTHQRLTLAAH